MKYFSNLRQERNVYFRKSDRMEFQILSGREFKHKEEKGRSRPVTINAIKHRHCHCRNNAAINNLDGLSP